MNCEIITLVGTNLGNRLQNYALQTVLRQLGCHVVTSITEGPKRPLLRWLKFRYYSYRNQTVHDKFIRFNQRIHWKKDFQSHLHDDPSIDFYIAGSDQIWNPHFKTTTDREFLRFAPERKRIAYAASMGVELLPSVCHAHYRQYISEIPHVSVREESGARIIKEITGRDVPVVLDPTLLLDRAEWDDIANDSRLATPDRYVVRYFLGGAPPAVDRKIKEYCKNNDLNEIDAMSTSERLFPSIGPSDFVKAISQAQHVYTDSFHAACLSIIYRRPFTVFSRVREPGFGNMISRLESLLNTFSLRNTVIIDYDNWNPAHDRVSYEQIESILFKHSDLSRMFLKNALS